MPAVHVAFLSGLEQDYATVGVPVLANNILSFVVGATTYYLRWETVLQYSVT